jgi:hypothetical protein
VIWLEEHTYGAWECLFQQDLSQQQVVGTMFGFLSIYSEGVFPSGGPLWSDQHSKLWRQANITSLAQCLGFYPMNWEKATTSG